MASNKGYSVEALQYMQAQCGIIVQGILGKCSDTTAE